MSAPERFEIAVPDEVLDDLRERLRRTRWLPQPEADPWGLGADVAYIRALCGHWAESHDWRRAERLLNGIGSFRWRGLHFLRWGADGERPPILLLHGWPTGPLLYPRLGALLREAGHEVVVPSLPGFGWSDDPGEPLGLAAASARLRTLAADGLGYERYAIHGEDWGAAIAARMALDSPEAVAALHVGTPGVLPRPGSLERPPLDPAEIEFAEAGRRWRRREGHHMVIQGLAPDAISVGLGDSPAGLAAYLVEKYRRWSDCGGELERRFSKDDLCDFLTMYWATGTIASSMRLYWGERRARWRPGPDERIEVPAGAAVFPGDVLCPPREWTARLLVDLRRWSEMPRGGHFAGFEEPELLAEDILALLDDL